VITGVGNVLAGDPMVEETVVSRAVVGDGLAKRRALVGVEATAKALEVVSCACAAKGGEEKLSAQRRVAMVQNRTS
jgi:hypothetical protein